MSHVPRRKVFRLTLCQLWSNGVPFYIPCIQRFQLRLERCSIDRSHCVSEAWMRLVLALKQLINGRGFPWDLCNCHKYWMGIHVIYPLGPEHVVWENDMPASSDTVRLHGMLSIGQLWTCWLFLSPFAHEKKSKSVCFKTGRHLFFNWVRSSVCHFGRLFELSDWLKVNEMDWYWCWKMRISVVNKEIHVWLHETICW